MRSSISAQSCASVPPCPALMSTKALCVHRAGEHAAELELGDLLLEPVGVRRDAGDRVASSLSSAAISSNSTPSRVRLGELVEQLDDVLELGALPAERLRLLRLVPDAGSSSSRRTSSSRSRLMS
jgi:hypothetical protein